MQVLLELLGGLSAQYCMGRPNYMFKTCLFSNFPQKHPLYNFFSTSKYSDANVFTVIIYIWIEDVWHFV